MCPDRELLSAYVDGEVPEPWNGRLARHLASCESCAKAVQRYRELSQRISGQDLAVEGLDEPAVLARIGAHLERSLDGRGAGVSALRPVEVWRRRVALPLPAAAAAALFVVALLVLSFLGLGIPGRHGGPALAQAMAPAPSASAIQATTAAELPPAGAQSMSMDELLHYLDAKNGEVTVTIRLPSGSSFERVGAPVLQVAGASDSSAKDGGR